MVRIAFLNEVCGDYVTNINVPTQTEVIIPYQTVEVDIDCIEGTIIEFAGERKTNKEGHVSFQNVLEGTYPLKVYDAFGNIKPYEESITVSDENRHFVVDDLFLSDLGSKRLEESINSFYTVYLEGIKKHDSKLLKNYVSMDNRQTILEEYETWFIKNKDVKNANIEIELEQIKLSKEGDVQVEALEMVNLVNQEKEVKGKVQNTEYQVVLKWDMLLKQDGESYKLQDRILKESLVSYKDKEDKWIAY